MIASQLLGPQVSCIVALMRMASWHMSSGGMFGNLLYKTPHHRSKDTSWSPSLWRSSQQECLDPIKSRVSHFNSYSLDFPLTFCGHANISAKGDSARRVVRIASAASKRFRQLGLAWEPMHAWLVQGSMLMTSVPAGVVDHAMDALAGCVANNPGEQNIRRNLHKLIHVQGKCLPLQISGAACHVKKAMGKIGVRLLSWPVILLSTWMHYALLNASRLLLAGWHITKREKWKNTFRKFWHKYRFIDPEHPIYHTDEPVDYGLYMPYTIHGDEGRGKNRVPVMVESFCPVISRHGPAYTNLTGHLVS